MDSYNDWTEIREYRIWQGEEVAFFVQVVQHTNGRVRVFEDSVLVQSSTSLTDAYTYAQNIANTLAQEAENECPCGLEPLECGEIYGLPHAVRIQVVDCMENRDLDFWER